MSEASLTYSQKLNAILDHFERSGFERKEPKLLQPTGVFLDRSGEDFRGRLYLTNDASGAEFCLRPEYTIPICLDYLKTDQLEVAAFAYGGSIFRAPEHGASGEGEFIQAGIESFGRPDREAADAEILASALDAARAAGANRLHVRMGDAGLVAAFLDCLDLPLVMRAVYRLATFLRRSSIMAQTKNRLACAQLSPASILQTPDVLLRTCSPSPALPPSGDAAPQRSPNVFLIKQRLSPEPACRGKSRRLLKPFLILTARLTPPQTPYVALLETQTLICQKR